MRFMTLYQPLHARLSRYVQSLIWQPDEAKDLLSDVTLEAFENFEKLREPSQFVYFLFGIARNLYLKELRGKKFQLPWDKDKMENLDGGVISEESLQRKELATLLGKLKPHQQDAITLFEVAGFKYEEIAEMMSTFVQKTIFFSFVMKSCFLPIKKPNRNNPAVCTKRPAFTAHKKLAFCPKVTLPRRKSLQFPALV